MISPPAALPSADPFRHEVLLYADETEYLAGTVPFVEAGLSAGEPVLVIVPQERLELLRTALPTTHPLLQMADMRTLGQNPARLIPAWTDFARPLLAEGRSTRGVGEPAWSARSADELAECAWHETLVNLAFGDAAGFSLLCPYDTLALDAAVIAGTHGSHPHVGGAHGADADLPYIDTVPDCLDGPLSPVPEGVEWITFDGTGHVELRARTRTAAVAAGLDPQTVDDAVLAVNEAVANTVRHGGGRGRLSTWSDRGAFVCEIRDTGRIDDPLAGRRRPVIGHAGGRGLWLMTQICDLVQIRRVEGGQAIRVRLSDPR
ncbi:MAG: MEDS domain-containing protein [Acidimicrobiia bacterium]|nr:MEDS domain-containing protein [Acidimicrobiia bacterium]